MCTPNKSKIEVHKTNFIKITLKSPTPFELFFLSLIGKYSTLGYLGLKDENEEIPFYKYYKSTGNFYFKGQQIIKSGRVVPENILRTLTLTKYDEKDWFKDWDLILAHENKLEEYNLLLHSRKRGDESSSPQKPTFITSKEISMMNIEVIEEIIEQLEKRKVKVASNLGFFKSTKATTDKVEALDTIINKLNKLIENKPLKNPISLKDFHDKISTLYNENKVNLEKKRSRFPISFFDVEQSTTEKSFLDLINLTSSADDSNFGLNSEESVGSKELFRTR